MNLKLNELKLIIHSYFTILLYHNIIFKTYFYTIIYSHFYKTIKYKIFLKTCSLRPVIIVFLAKYKCYKIIIILFF